MWHIKTPHDTMTTMQTVKEHRTQEINRAKLTNIENLPDAAYVREAQLISTPERPGLLPIGSSTLWRYVHDPAKKFPQPLKLSARVTVWKLGDVRAWLAQQGAATSQRQRTTN